MEKPLDLWLRGTYVLVAGYKKTLHGLKQAPRAWFVKFNKFISQFGTILCCVDHLVFRRCATLNKLVYLVMYVDDFVIRGDDQSRRH